MAAGIAAIGRTYGPGIRPRLSEVQLQMHFALVKLYQTEASQSPETDMAKFAITNLAQIQRVFDQAKRLGAERGVSVDTVKAPPQY